MQNRSRSCPASSACRASLALAAAVLLVGCVTACSDEKDRDHGEGIFPGEPDLSDVTEERTNDLIWSILGEAGDGERNRKRYLDLMKLSLADLLYEDDPAGRMRRIQGWDWPSRGYTMIGLKRLKHIEWCFNQAQGHDIPGDLIEAGAWRGGATIYMRALLAAYAVTDRKVWVADSFEGMPVPQHPEDAGLDLSDIEELAVSVEEVQTHFRRYGLLDDRVKFLKGWFEDTLPNAPIEKLALLRIDADLYQSTMDALVNLYPKLQKGACVIIDDYWVPACRRSVHDFREQNGISTEIQQIDSQGVFWLKE